MRKCIESNLQLCLHELQKKQVLKISDLDLNQIIQQVMDSLDDNLSQQQLSLYEELSKMSECINMTKQELQNLRPHEIMHQHIPEATDHLEAVIQDTEQATNTILDTVGIIENLAPQMPESIAAQVQEAATQIYEASNFQDITSQRIRKVVKMIKDIEERIAVLMNVLGAQVQQAEYRKEEELSQEEYEKTLLNGPQLPQAASSQDDIDALFSQF